MSIFTRLRNLFSAPGWSFSATALSANRRAATEGETVVISSVVRNTGVRLGTVYLRLLIADSYKRSTPLFDSHRDLSPNARNAFRIADIPPGHDQRFAFSWEVPDQVSNRHLDLRLEVWNPHFLFDGPYPFKFADSGWVGGFEVLKCSLTSQPRVFISYSHDDAEHVAWVRQLAEELRRHDLEVVLDGTHLQLGEQITHFIETAIRSSAVLLLVCSKGYTEKANSRLPSGVGYETVITSSEYYHSTPEQRLRFIPIVRRNTLPANRLLPAYLGTAYYENMSGDDWRAEPLQSVIAAIKRIVATNGSPPGAGTRAIS
jgi:hypothetical protein